MLFINQRVCLIFACKSGAYLSEEPFNCSTLGQVLGLSYKYQSRLERLASVKHSSLLCNFTNYVGNLQMLLVKQHVYLMFVGMAGTHSSEEPFNCSTLGQVLGLSHKYQSRLERLVSVKYSCLLCNFTNYGSNLKVLFISQWVCLLFAGKAGAYLSEAPFKCSTFEQVPGLGHKYQSRLH